MRKGTSPNPSEGKSPHLTSPLGEGLEASPPALSLERELNNPLLTSPC